MPRSVLAVSLLALLMGVVAGLRADDGAGRRELGRVI